MSNNARLTTSIDLWDCVVQGNSADELPESLLGTMRLCSVRSVPTGCPSTIAKGIHPSNLKQCVPPGTDFCQQSVLKHLIC